MGHHFLDTQQNILASYVEYLNIFYLNFSLDPKYVPITTLVFCIIYTPAYYLVSIAQPVYATVVRAKTATSFGLQKLSTAVLRLGLDRTRQDCPDPTEYGLFDCRISGGVNNSLKFVKSEPDSHSYRSNLISDSISGGSYDTTRKSFGR